MKYAAGIVAIVIIGGGIYFLSQQGRSAPAHTGQSATSAKAQSTSQSASSAEKLPALTLKDYGGKDIALSSFAGKPLIVNSWASWCPFCRQELPDFATAQKELGDTVVVVAIDRAEPLAVAKGYTDKQGTTGTVIFLLDPSDSFYQSIGGFSMPETIFVDKNGTIVDHKRGPMDLKEIRERTRKILAPASESQGTTAVENLVTYSTSGFSPNTLRVKVGATVTFKNSEPEPIWIASNPHPTHTAYSAFNATRGYAQGESYSFTFTKPGKWNYHNHLNPSKGGTIIVE